LQARLREEATDCAENDCPENACSENDCSENDRSENDCSEKDCSEDYSEDSGGDLAGSLSPKKQKVHCRGRLLRAGNERKNPPTILMHEPSFPIINICATKID
jgi:hypothetical protein